MFNLHSINQHLSDLKFDLASQALASSQTLIKSFRNLVNSIVAKIINDDALIKGQTNGPENFKVKITDACIDLTNIKDEYNRYLKVASQQSVLPLIMPGSELGVEEAELIANTRFSAYLSNYSAINKRAEIISFIRQPGLARPVLKDSYGINAIPECVFAPLIANNYNPAYSAMFNRQIVNTNYMQTQSFYKPLNSTGFTRPIWFSIKPIVLSSPNLSGTPSNNVIMSKVDKLTDDTFEALNCYYCQAVECQPTGSNTYIALHSTMILYTMVQGRFDDIEHPNFARIAYKWYRDSLGQNINNENNTILYYARRNTVNGICEGKTDFDGYDIVSPSDFGFSLGSGFYSYSSDKILNLFTNLCQGEASSRTFVELEPTTIVDPPNVDALYNDGQLTITKALTQVDDGYSINDIHVSMGAFMGNLTSVMQDIINDLNSADYE